MYIVALFKNSDGDYYVHYEKDNLQISSNELDYAKTLGYKLVHCLITTDRTTALNTRLKFRIKELKSLKPDVDYLGYDECLINQIGLLTSRLLSLGVDVTDEIALQCYDIKQQRMTKV